MRVRAITLNDWVQGTEATQGGAITPGEELQESALVLYQPVR